MHLRPEKIVLVCGTGTGVGKTWVAGWVLEELRARGLKVAARKPAQSFDVDAEGSPLGGATDSEILGAASGEPPTTVCLPTRTYHRAMAPPMAADSLGYPQFTVADLIGEIVWPDHQVDVGLVEMAGGVRSPQAHDGDVTDFVHLLRPDLVILVADAGLGTINGVRLSIDALSSFGGVEMQSSSGQCGPRVPLVVVVLDRFDSRHEIHRRNREWLIQQYGFEIVTLPGDESLLVDRLEADR